VAKQYFAATNRTVLDVLPAPPPDAAKAGGAPPPKTSALGRASTHARAAVTEVTP